MVTRRNPAAHRVRFPFALLVCIAFGATLLRASARELEGGRPVARRVEPGPPHWRSLRLIWRTSVSTNDLIGQRVRDMQRVDDRLYYVGESELGCVSADTGKPVWQQPLVPPGGRDQPGHNERDRRLTVADGAIFLSEAHVYGPPPPAPYQVLAFDDATGKPLWKRDQNQRLSGHPALAESTVLVATHDGSVLALRRADGSIRWQKRWMRAPTGGSTAPALHVRAAGPIGVVQPGGQDLVGFRVRDGHELWRVRALPTSAHSDFGEGFTVTGGVAYAVLAVSELTAVEVATGKRLWTRRATGASASLPEVAGKQILAEADGTVVSLERKHGATEWFRPPHDHPTLLPGTGIGTGAAALLKISTEPRLTAAPAATLSLSQLDTLVALDPTTGAETWRWQPYEGVQLEQVIRDQDRLLITDGSELFCFGPGEPEALPADAEARVRLARETVAALFRGPSRPSSADGHPRLAESMSEKNEGRLRLLRLGKEAVPALLAQARTDLEREERSIPSSQQLKYQREQPFRHEQGSVLDLLADIGAPEGVAELIRLADALRNPFSLDGLAEALVHYGDRRAAPFLLRYARSAEADPVLARAALYFACRAGDAAGLDQREITAYLLAELQREQSPLWLRQYARFELLNERGEVARSASLAAWGAEPTAQLLPGPVVNVGKRPRWWGPFRFSLQGAVRDPQGTWWSTCTSAYLGYAGQHLWLAQSRDGNKWDRLAYLQKLPPELGYSPRLKQRYRSGNLTLDVTGERWEGETKIPVRRQFEVSLADVYCDTDGDGLPDRLERLVGTDPEKADTNGNGIPDALDRSPASGPRVLTDEEAIYQAVLEGLCQLGRTAPVDPRSAERFTAAPSVLGRKTEPLVLPLPPGSRGIEIRSHPGMVLFQQPPPPSRRLPGEPLWHYFQFAPPYIGLDGTEATRRHLRAEPDAPHDPFQPVVNTPDPPHLSFQEFCPYELSADRTRARVGWVEQYWGLRSSSDAFDVEVRKIGGRWYPVECRQIYATFSFARQVVPVPVRPLR